MIPSDPNYGGSSPQIAKGGVNKGEDVRSAAIREGKEELGLDPSNIKTITSVLSAPLDARYRLSVFIAWIKQPAQFAKTDSETQSKRWLTLHEFVTSGRQDQLVFVQAAYNHIQKTIQT